MKKYLKNRINTGMEYVGKTAHPAPTSKETSPHEVRASGGWVVKQYPPRSRSQQTSETNTNPSPSSTVYLGHVRFRGKDRSFRSIDDLLRITRKIGRAHV